MTTLRPVAVTGIGCVGPWGIGLDGLDAALAEGTPLRRPIDRGAGYHRDGGAALAAVVPELDLSHWVPPMVARRISALSRLAIAAARLAVDDAGLDDVAGERTAVSLATQFGPGAFTEQLVRQILERGGKAASPFLFTDCVASAPAGQVAIALGARGANDTICQREAGPLHAIANGAAEVAAGRSDRCLAGAVDEMEPLVHAILDRLGGLARGDELPRPFDRERRGVLAGEGCTVLLLEAEEIAATRGAPVLARVGGSARAFDPSASRAGYGEDGAALGRALRERLGDARIDAVVSGASGARDGDRAEADVLRAAFDRLPPVVAPKAVHGEFGGGTAAAGLLALRGTAFARPAACTAPDLGIELHDGTLRARRVLLSALGSGGSAAWLWLEAP